VIDDLRGEHRLERLCQVLQGTRSGYYAWKKRAPSTGALRRQALAEKIRQIHKNSRGTYGSLRVYREIQNQGTTTSRATVSRLMRDCGIAAKMKKKFRITTKTDAKLALAPNLLNRDFAIKIPNRVYLSDITYLWTLEGFVYLCTVMDLATRRIVGWQISERMTVDLVTDAISSAIHRERPRAGAIFHSDRGSQFAAKECRALLGGHGFLQSMSRKGNCWDNAPMESFFHTLKTEHIAFERFETRAQVRASVFEWIEVFYNRIRLHSSLDYKSPQRYFEERSAAA
jgi:putative transposase